MVLETVDGGAFDGEVGFEVCELFFYGGVAGGWVGDELGPVGVVGVDEVGPGVGGVRGESGEGVEGVDEGERLVEVDEEVYCEGAADVEEGGEAEGEAGAGSHGCCVMWGRDDGVYSCPDRTYSWAVLFNKTVSFEV